MSETAKRLLKLQSNNRFARKDGPVKMLVDRTSHRIKDYAINQACIRINELHSPFWYKK